MTGNDNKQALYWTAGVMGLVIVLALLAYAMGWLTPAL